VRHDAEAVLQRLADHGGLIERRLDLDVDETGVASGLQEARDRRAGRPQLMGDRLHREVLHVIQMGGAQGVLGLVR
jgi:hypothetical protein